VCSDARDMYSFDSHWMLLPSRMIFACERYGGVLEQRRAEATMRTRAMDGARDARVECRADTCRVVRSELPFPKIGLFLVTSK
jgi:hypothetical protein